MNRILSELDMKTKERTIDEAFEEFLMLSKLPKWRQWVYRFFHKPLFPLCVRVDDSRIYEEDTDEDYLLKKHFVEITEEEPGLFALCSYVTREAEGQMNEPYEIDAVDDGYRWPVRSIRHARKMIPDFVHSVQMTAK